MNQSFSPSSPLQEPTTNNESTEINNYPPSLPPVSLPTPTTTIPSEESSSIVPDEESSSNPKLRRSKRNRIPNNNVYGGKSGLHSCQSTIDNSFIHALDRNDLTTSITSTDHASFMTVINENLDPYSQVYETIHSMFPASNVNAADTPNYHQAMTGPDQAGYSNAMDLEVATLKDKMDAWDVVPRTPDMHILPSTWAFCCKRYPDGLVRKLKARFCVRRDRQIEGVDFFKTFAPIVQWDTVRLLLILSIHLNLATMQIDYTSAFLHADIDDTVFVEMPRGYEISFFI